ncbi:hypothetical protein D9757_001612 [Collybiopsis confluens]|uniref:DUF6534 domain-containing protein n=1 Tax=Collybiopsis confluens TaxID=2823264 RepID=A0A8H5HZF9_9AGAR|nr:hypothetical protein D9757_001612 [Collybiopsis confluens]
MEALDNTFGAALIGVIVAGVLLGVSLLQAYYYFSQQNDTPVVRSLVAAVVFFDVVHQIMISHTVSSASKLLQTWLPTSRYRCSLPIPALGNKKLASAAGDVLIAGTLTFLLQTSKTGFSRSDTMLNKLTLFAVNTGALTSLCAVASLISVSPSSRNLLYKLVKVLDRPTLKILAAPNTFIYISFFFCMGRLYTNSLLATLNARKMIRSAGENVHTTSGPNISFSFGSFARSFTKPAVSFASSANSRLTQPTELDIKIDTVHELRTQDYHHHHHQTNSKKEESDYGDSVTNESGSLTNLSNGSVEASVEEAVEVNAERSQSLCLAV